MSTTERPTPITPTTPPVPAGPLPILEDEVDLNDLSAIDELISDEKTKAGTDSTEAVTPVVVIPTPTIPLSTTAPTASISSVETITTNASSTIRIENKSAIEHGIGPAGTPTPTVDSPPVEQLAATRAALPPDPIPSLSTNETSKPFIKPPSIANHVLQSSITPDSQTTTPSTNVVGTLSSSPVAIDPPILSSTSSTTTISSTINPSKIVSPTNTQNTAFEEQNPNSLKKVTDVALTIPTTLPPNVSLLASVELKQQSVIPAITPETITSTNKSTPDVPPLNLAEIKEPSSTTTTPLVAETSIHPTPEQKPKSRRSSSTSVIELGTGSSMTISISSIAPKSTVTTSVPATSTAPPNSTKSSVAPKPGHQRIVSTSSHSSASSSPRSNNSLTVSPTTSQKSSRRGSLERGATISVTLDRMSSTNSTTSSSLSSHAVSSKPPTTHASSTTKKTHLAVGGGQGGSGNPPPRPSHRKMSSTQISPTLTAATAASAHRRAPSRVPIAVATNHAHASTIPHHSHHSRSLSFSLKSSPSPSPTTPIAATPPQGVSPRSNIGSPTLAAYPSPRKFTPADYSLLLYSPLELDRKLGPRRPGAPSLRQMTRAMSFGELNKTSVPLWVAAEVRVQAKADQAFEVTRLQQENKALREDLEEAKLTIADIRYAQYRKDAQTEKQIELHKSLQELAEKNLEAMSMKYMQKRLVIRAYRQVLAHTAVTHFNSSYQVKKKMRQLQQEVVDLVKLIDSDPNKEQGLQRKEASSMYDTTNLNDLNLLVPQNESRAFLAVSDQLWNNKYRSLSFTNSDQLITNLLDGLDSLRTAMTSSLQLTREYRATTDAIFERNKAIMTENVSMKADLEYLNAGAPDLWKQPKLLQRAIEKIKDEDRAAAYEAELAAQRQREQEEAAARRADTIASRRLSASPARQPPSKPSSANMSVRARRPLSAKVMEEMVQPPMQHATPINPPTMEFKCFVPTKPNAPTASTSITRIALSSNGLAYHHGGQTARNLTRNHPASHSTNRLQARGTPYQSSSHARYEEEAKMESTPSITQFHLQHPAASTNTNHFESHSRFPPLVPSTNPPVDINPGDGADDEMMLGWHGDFDDDIFQQHRQQQFHPPSMRPHQPPPPLDLKNKCISGPSKSGKQRFRLAVARVILRARRTNKHFHSALHEFRSMDLENMHLDPDHD